MTTDSISTDQAPETAAPEAAEVVSQESAQESASPEAQPEPVKAKPKVRLGGQEVEVDEAVAEMKKGADARYQEAAQLRKEAQAQLEALKFAKENPREFFKITGVDAKAFAEQLLLEELEESLLTDEQKELKKYRNAEKESAKQRELSESQAKAAAQEREYNEAAEQIESEILGVLKEQGIDKPNARQIARIADIMIASLEAEEGRRMHAKDAFQRVQEYQRQDVLSFISELSPELIEAQYPDIYKAILKHSANKVAPVGQTLPDDMQPASRQRKQTLTHAELWRQIRQGE
jgi:DNA-binding ferritin-like protein (Dps family)